MQLILIIAVGEEIVGAVVIHVPGERITAGIVDYLRSGLAAGMTLPDPADPSLTTIRVTASG